MGPSTLETLSPAPSPQAATEALRTYTPLEIMDLLFSHCDRDALIALGSLRATARNPEPHPMYLAPVRVRDRWDMLPGIFEYCVEQTQYLMPNTLTMAALHGRQPEEYRLDEKARKLYFQAANRHVGELNALTIDLDVGRGPDDLTAEQATAAAMDIAREGRIPYPTMTATSGRGAYLFWLLQADGIERRPPKVTPETVAQWKLIAGELRELTRHLKSDPIPARRLASWYKRPGTLDAKTGHTVFYRPNITADGGMPVYRMDDLCASLGIAHAPDDLRLPVDAKDTEPREQRLASAGGIGPAAPFRARKRDLESLNRHRGGIREGRRQTFLRCYYNALVSLYRVLAQGTGGAAKQAARQAQRETHYLNQGLPRPLSVADLQHTIFGGNRVRPRNSTVVRSLGITEAEAVACEMVSLIPGRLKTERQRIQAEQATLKRQRREEVRRETERLVLETDWGPSKIASTLTKLYTPPEHYGLDVPPRTLQARVNAARKRLEIGGRKRPADVVRATQGTLDPSILGDG